MKTGILALVMMCVAGAPSAAQLYRWVDENGNVHYSDQPPPPQARSAQRKRLGDKPGEGPGSYALQQAMKDIEDLGVLVKDIDTGLCDFPHTRDGRVVYLCWKLDEDEISWWHDLESGFAGRQPL